MADKFKNKIPKGAEKDYTIYEPIRAAAPEGWWAGKGARMDTTRIFGDAAARRKGRAHIPSASSKGNPRLAGDLQRGDLMDLLYPSYIGARLWPRSGRFTQLNKGGGGPPADRYGPYQAPDEVNVNSSMEGMWGPVKGDLPTHAGQPVVNDASEVARLIMSLYPFPEKGGTGQGWSLHNKGRDLGAPPLFPAITDASSRFGGRMLGLSDMELSGPRLDLRNLPVPKFRAPFTPTRPKITVS
jgi:hypothetical protein